MTDAGKIELVEPIFTAEQLQAERDRAERAEKELGEDKRDLLLEIGGLKAEITHLHTALATAENDALEKAAKRIQEERERANGHGSFIIDACVQIIRSLKTK